MLTLLFLQSLINAISRVRFENGKSPAVVRQFLIDQLRYNDNTANPVSIVIFLLGAKTTKHKMKYSDAFYICTVLSALASATVSTVPPERGELQKEAPAQENAEDANLVKSAIAEIDRYRSMDRLIPSPHNVVTIAAMEVRICHTNCVYSNIHQMRKSFTLSSPLRALSQVALGYSSL